MATCLSTRSNSWSRSRAAVRGKETIICNNAGRSGAFIGIVAPSIPRCAAGYIWRGGLLMGGGNWFDYGCGCASASCRVAVELRYRRTGTGVESVGSCRCSVARGSRSGLARMELERCALQHLPGRGDDRISHRAGLHQRPNSCAFCVQHAVERH